MRLYGLLLYLYPAAFRNRYGEEMHAILGQRRREASGPLAVVALRLTAILVVGLGVGANTAVVTVTD
jgi:hypothetical protein